MRHALALVVCVLGCAVAGCAQRDYVYTPVEEDTYTRHAAEQRARDAAVRNLGLASRRYDSGLLAQLEARQRAAVSLQGGPYAPAGAGYRTFTTGTYTTYPGRLYYGSTYHGGFYSTGGLHHGHTFHSGGLHLRGGYAGNPSFYFNVGGHHRGR